MNPVARAFGVWREAVKSMPKPKSRRRDEYEFLPAAVEILERPASPAGRAIVILICTFFAVALIWSWFGHVDIVAVAQGQIIPSGRSKVIQAPELAVIRAIHVRDGQRVTAGETMIELDPTDSTADRDRLARQLETAQVVTARLMALLARDRNPMQAFAPPASADAALVATQRALLASEIAELRAQLAALDQEHARRNAQLAVIDANIDRLESTLPLLQARVQAIRELSAQGYAPKLRLLELEEQELDGRKQLASERERREEAVSAIRAIIEERDAAEKEYLRGVNERLAEAREEIQGATQELKKAERRRELQAVTAPIDGVVQQLAVNTIGGIVQPAQELLVVVPQGSRLEAEVAVLNKDVGFVAEGQAAEIKVDPFPYTKYGVIDGEVTSLSRDAVPDEERGPVYMARVALAQGTIRVEDKDVPLAPGMATTVEIKTGKRRIIEFLLAPLFRYRDESLKER